jgi:hypothetical protein
MPRRKAVKATSKVPKVKLQEPDRTGAGFQPMKGKRVNRFSSGYLPADERLRAKYVHPDGSPMTDAQIIFQGLMAYQKK